MTNQTTSLRRIAVPAIAVGIAIGIRIIATIVFDDAYDHDPDAYASFAHNVATHGIYGWQANEPSAHRPPVYPLLLAPWCRSWPPTKWGIVALHLAATIVAVLSTAGLAESFGLRQTSAVAGTLVAADPLLVRQFTLIMSETVFLGLFCAMLLCWLDWSRPSPLIDRAQRLRWAALLPVGFLVAASVLTRPIALAVWLGLGLASVLERRVSDWCISTVIALIAALPWLLRNLVVMGAPILTTSHGGYTLWLGQNPEYYSQVVAGSNNQWPSESHADWTARNATETAGMTEIDRDRHFRRRAWDWMLAEPIHAARSMLHHIAMLWSPTPHDQPAVVRWVCGVYYAALYVLVLCGLAQPATWQPRRIAYPVILLTVTLVHAVYWSDVRMRAPLIPVLSVLAAAGVERAIPIIRAFSSERTSGRAPPTS